MNGNVGNPFANNFINILQQYNQFKSQFQGNPQEQVQQLINSGKMTQSQFNQYQMMASQFQKMMRSK